MTEKGQVLPAPKQHAYVRFLPKLPLCMANADIPAYGSDDFTCV